MEFSWEFWVTRRLCLGVSFCIISRNLQEPAREKTLLQSYVAFTRCPESPASRGQGARWLWLLQLGSSYLSGRAEVDRVPADRGLCRTKATPAFFCFSCLSSDTAESLQVVGFLRKCCAESSEVKLSLHWSLLCIGRFSGISLCCSSCVWISVWLRYTCVTFYF